jgi:hypothetical protein
MRFEHGEEYSKYDHHWDTITDRDNVSKFDCFGEEGSCYFDFAGFVGDILDIIFGSYGPRVDLGEG